MADKPENPNAFPAPKNPLAYQNAFGPGMTLRDWFAGQALIGLGLSLNPAHVDQYARSAYAYADALLTEREQGEK